MRILSLAGVAMAILCAVPAMAADTAGALVLDRLVVVERHGVRSPTQPPEALARFAAQPWPAWPVAPGLLTDHGRRDIVLMGGWIRADYARRGLWPAKGCLKPDAVYVWADGKDQRTRVSGQALLDGAFPGCGLNDHFGAEDQTDAVFSATDAGRCPVDIDEARRAVIAQAGGDLDRPGAGYMAAKAALTGVIASNALDGSNTLDAGKTGGLRMSGPLATASTLTENLYLEYAQGMPEAEVGWGRAGSQAAIASVMPLHNISSNLMRRTPYVAAHNGALMMRAVLAALGGRSALPGQGAAGSSLVAIAGHDTNLANLGGILGVGWTLADQPDSTPPGAALVFEVWKRPADGERFVRLAVIYQTLDQLRGETPLTSAHPAGRVDIPVPGCADGPQKGCPLARFQAMIEARLPPECRLGADAAIPVQSRP